MHAYLPAFHHYAGIDQRAVRDQACVYLFAFPSRVPNLRNIDLPNIFNPRSNRVENYSWKIERPLLNFHPSIVPLKCSSPTLKIPIPISTSLSPGCRIAAYIACIDPCFTRSSYTFPRRTRRGNRSGKLRFVEFQLRDRPATIIPPPPLPTPMDTPRS